MKSHILSVVEEEGGFQDGTLAYRATYLGLKGCHSWGHTFEEALVNIQEAVQFYMEYLNEAGDTAP